MDNVAVLALDIHKNFSKAVAMDDKERILDEWRIGHGDREVMAEFLRHFDSGTPVVMEATFNWPWIADVAEAMGLAPHLAHAQRAREMAKGMAKSDRKDAIFLGKLYLAGSNVFPESYLAPPEVRRMRCLFRQRLLLVRLRVAVKNALHGQLFRLGVVIDDEDVSDLFSVKGRRLLAALQLETKERWLLERKLSTIDVLGRHIDILREVLERDLAEDSRSEILMSIPGIGKLTAYTVLAEIGDIGRFPDRRALAAYAGLLPLDRESGGKDFGKHTNRSCNRYLRWAALEAVTGAVRRSPRMRSLHVRVKSRNPRQPGKARVAVARQIIETAYLLLRSGELYQEDPPPRPGSARAKRQRNESHPNRASQSPLCARPE
jgi:transposase